MKERTTAVALLLNCPLVVVAGSAPDHNIRKAGIRVGDRRFDKRLAATAGANPLRSALWLLLLLLRHTNTPASVQ